MINYFKAAERLLAQRGNLEQALENLGRRRELASTQAKAERDNIKPRPYASSGGINAHTSARLELAEINREIVATRSTIAEIDRVLAQLDDADAELLRAWYIEHKSKYPHFSKIKTEPDDALPTYEGPVNIGRLVKADLTVNLASGKLYADDELAESVDEFSSGSVAMETDDMTDDVAAEVYGCTVEEKKVHYKAGDSAPLGGLAYYKVLMRKGVKLFKGYFYPRVKAVLGNDNAATKADSITFGTNSTTFTVFRCNSDDWRITEELTTEAAAKAWVRTSVFWTPSRAAICFAAASS